MFSRVFLLTRVWILEVWVEIWVLSTFASCINRSKMRFKTKKFFNIPDKDVKEFFCFEPQRVPYPKNCSSLRMLKIISFSFMQLANTQSHVHKMIYMRQNVSKWETYRNLFDEIYRISKCKYYYTIGMWTYLL